MNSFPFVIAKQNGKQKTKQYWAFQGKKGKREISRLVLHSFLAIHMKRIILCPLEGEPLVRGSASRNVWWEVSQWLPATGGWELDPLGFFLMGYVCQLLSISCRACAVLQWSVRPAVRPHNRDKSCSAANRTETSCLICGLWTQLILFTYGFLAAVVEEEHTPKGDDGKTGEMNE